MRINAVRLPETCKTANAAQLSWDIASKGANGFSGMAITSRIAILGPALAKKMFETARNPVVCKTGRLDLVNKGLIHGFAA